MGLNINFDSKRDFQDIKICRNRKFQSLWVELEISVATSNSEKNTLVKFWKCRKKET